MRVWRRRARRRRRHCRADCRLIARRFDKNLLFYARARACHLAKGFAHCVGGGGGGLLHTFAHSFYATSESQSAHNVAPQAK